MTGQSNQSISTNAVPAGQGGVSAKDSAKPPPSGKHQSARRRRLIFAESSGDSVLRVSRIQGIPNQRAAARIKTPTTQES
jgi:hypothetical protein